MIHWEYRSRYNLKEVYREYIDRAFDIMLCMDYWRYHEDELKRKYWTGHCKKMLHMREFGSIDGYVAEEEEKKI